jgi:hypothetical protein
MLIAPTSCYSLFTRLHTCMSGHISQTMPDLTRLFETPPNIQQVSYWRDEVFTEI